MSPQAIGLTTKAAIIDDLGYLIERIRKIQRGQEKGLDVKPQGIGQALKTLSDTRDILNDTLIASPE